VTLDGLPVDWAEALGEELGTPGFAKLLSFVEEADAVGAIYPPAADRFRALALTALHDVKVVILGQDPYHGPGQAHGLCFSVRDGVKPPPSLVNIFKEIEVDLGLPRPASGCLERWARQGVLLLNSVLTVEAGKAGSHARRGWEQVTDAIVRAVAAKPEPVVFMLWGAYAQAKAEFVESVEQGGRHLVLKAPHPSPLSAYNGWFGSGHFSKANAFLKANGRGAIDWRL
jgi:uracil-DNA glycosylase